MTEIGPEVGLPDEQPFDASDPEQVRAKRRTAGTRKAKERAFLKKALNDPEGRNWFWGILERTHMTETSFIQGDPHASAFREGERNIGLQIWSELQAVDAAAFVRMLTERGRA